MLTFYADILRNMIFPKLILKYKEEEELFKDMQLVSLLQFFKEETGNTKSYQKTWLKVHKFNILVENIKQLQHTVNIKKRNKNLKQKISWLRSLKEIK